MVIITSTNGLVSANACDLKSAEISCNTELIGEHNLKHREVWLRLCFLFS